MSKLFNLVLIIFKMGIEEKNNYLSKKFEILKSGHLVTDCLINRLSAKVIIDTGASNSCIDSNSVEIFKIKIENYHETASSATEKIKNIKSFEGDPCDRCGNFTVYKEDKKIKCLTCLHNFDE